MFDILGGGSTDADVEGAKGSLDILENRSFMKKTM